MPLNLDPEFLATKAKKRQEDEIDLVAWHKRVRASLDVFSRQNTFSKLSRDEQFFISNCESLIGALVSLSSPQANRLIDLAARHQSEPSSPEDDDSPRP